MRLVADSMLGKLARWLRLAGISVEKVPHEDDSRIVAFVKRRGALLLTADRSLADRSKRRRFRVLLVRETDLNRQMAYVVRSLGLRMKDKPGVLCPVCNTRLKRVDKKKIGDSVPKNAFEKHNFFYLCGNCKRIYWMGTHWLSIRKRLKRIKKIVG